MTLAAPTPATDPDPSLSAWRTRLGTEESAVAERQGSQDQARRLMETTRESELAPAETSAAQAIDQPAPTAPRHVEYPEYQPKPVVNAKDYEGLGMALLGMALIGGAASKGNWLGVMAPLNGALKGFLEGSEEKAAKDFQDYQTKYGEAKGKEDQANREFKDVLESRKLTINEKLARMKILSAKWDRQDMRMASEQKSVDRMWEQLNAHEQALSQAEERHNLVMAQLQNRMDVAKQAGGGPDALMDQDTLRFMARQALQGDRSVIQNVGRGRQGAVNLSAFRKILKEEADLRDISPEKLAMINAEFSGLQAGERTLGTRTANVGMAVNEANKFADLVLQASNKVKRTEYPDLNRIILAGERRTGNTDVVQFGAALNSFINAYARAVSPSGTPTVSDKEHAREIISTDYSRGQIAAAIEQLKKEMQAAKEAPAATKQELRDLGLGGKSGGVPPTKNAKGWTLHTDAAGNRAYVGPNQEIEEVP